ncbi:MAG: hypothetical protein H7317_15415 [Pseudorhodobacter sp.]|nr:hypothetical protein [Pseudorhodobacter sp.]
MRLLWAELWSMFVDDGALAVQVVVLVAGLAVASLVVPPLWCAVVLALGCAMILGASVLRARPKSGPH